MEKNVLDWIAMVILIIGGLNWAFTALGYNLVETLLGTGVAASIVYYLVGLSALYAIYFLVKK
ncbi:MAG: DUF378 domain-containing protein [Nanoarchaeota archaeon]|nr:DUF378 domain-containing protein [Nanoarchaeota archaeon]